MEIPASLRKWFVAHFIVDLLVAVPLLVAPEHTLRLLGWTVVDPLATRLVAAALVAIGGQSYLGRNDELPAYRAMLNLKLLWSGTAIAALLVAAGSGAPQAIWALLSIFVAFFGVWVHYRIRMKQWSSADARGME
jgi:hypothetical protein